ncbi:hypothetical protein B5X24_HaOG200706 [Helicoverpa armigera]|uniref:Gustatory receptor n=1 Tax=Helicoverpa armigera TaxID=29058 RepID=A0A2W1BV35_HELAM|nr:hypothetical protein B5X24_HaOG200706 [Helicoverpa armigera]
MTPYSREVLLNNRLDKDVQRILFPFNFFLTMFLSSKYCIRDNYITPSKRKYYVFGLFGICIITAANVHQMYGQIANMDLNKRGLLILIFLHVTQIFNFALSIVLNIIDCHKNVLLIVIIQAIHRSFDFSKSIRNLVFYSWMILLIGLCINVYTIAYGYAILQSWHILSFIHDVLMVVLDIDLIYKIRLLILLTTYLNEWIKNICLKKDDWQQDQANCVNLFATYQNILKAYDVSNELSEIIVSYEVYL